MTTIVCDWCGQPMEPARGNRPKKFCSGRCQVAESRWRTAEPALRDQLAYHRREAKAHQRRTGTPSAMHLGYISRIEAALRRPTDAR